MNEQVAQGHVTDDSTDHRVSRRRFLHGAGVAGTLALAAPVLGRAQDATPTAGVGATPGLIVTTLPESWDHEADVIVVGSGAAAFAAAVTAHQGGAEVLILEKAVGIGGTTQISGNAYWIPNNSQMLAEGLTDPREDALKYMARLSYPQLYDPESPTLGLSQYNFDMIATFFDNASVAIDSFEEWGSLFSINESTTPDYHADLPENVAPYGRYMSPDAERGPGATVPTQMQAWTDAQGIPLLNAHRVIGVYQNGAGEVVGVLADNDGQEVTARARKAVVFGTGGFTQDEVKSLNYLRGPIFAGCGVPSCTGDFVDIGLSLGAEFGNMNQAWWLQMPLELALKSPALPGADVWLPYGDSMIIVNKYGDRVTSEKMVYNERSQTHFYWDPARREYRNLVQFMIYDEAVAQNPTEWQFRYPVPLPGDDEPIVISGDTWEELAANINERLDSVRGQRSVSARIGPDVRLADNFVERLGTTIERFNGFAETGVDEDFARGSTPIQVAWQGPPREENMPNPTMAAFADEGPYHCIMLGGGTLDTKGGPVTDTSARVQHVTGTTIPGLYAAGNCAASPAGQAYWAAGGTIGVALAFGYIAGLNAATEGEKSIS